MTNAVFINDHPFYTFSQDLFFTSGTLNKNIWSRFTNHFGDLTIVGRGRIIAKEECIKYDIASIDGVYFDLFFEIKGGFDYIKYRHQIEKKLETYILNCKFIILRLPSYIGVIAANLCKKYKKKYIVEVVGCAFDSLWFFGGLSAKAFAIVNYFNTRKAIASCNGAVYVTESFLQKRYPTKSPYINASNVIIEDVCVDILKQHQKYLDRERSEYIFGVIGNIDLVYKGHKILFKALKKLPIQFKLILIGGGNDKYIKDLISKYSLNDNVEILGKILNREKLLSYIDSLDIYIQPSLTEGLPRSVIEAMSRGCPVIASNVGGIPELIGIDKLYDPKDYKKLRSIILSTIKSRIKMKKMSLENFNRSKKYQLSIINGKRNVFFSNIKNQIIN